MFWEKVKGWMRSHWKTVAAISLAMIAAIVVGAVCANPVGAPIVAAVAAIKIFSAIATMSPIWIPFVMGGLAAAATLIAAVTFNAATWVANWLDKKIDKKGAGAEKDASHHYPDIDDARSRRAMSQLGGQRNAATHGHESQGHYPSPHRRSRTPADIAEHTSRSPSNGIGL
ncbi:hypothetical protein [Legionella sp. CNM-4043-24]|uniref:hypothetical protein n=1 Tax=Legionella sp. CNM-4043-24 TaxID=3421646 RepID=UPI00403B34B3